MALLLRAQPEHGSIAPKSTHHWKVPHTDHTYETNQRFNQVSTPHISQDIPLARADVP
jgi:hypothetical protein